MKFNSLYRFIGFNKYLFDVLVKTIFILNFIASKNIEVCHFVKKRDHDFLSLHSLVLIEVQTQAEIYFIYLVIYILKLLKVLF